MTQAREPELLPFAAWAAVGAGLCAAAFTILSIGILVLAASVLGIAALIRWRGPRDRSAAGLLAGLGAIPLLIAYLNRGGPGTVCSAISRGEECTQMWSPWPFLAVGFVLIGAGVATAFWLRRQMAG